MGVFIDSDNRCDNFKSLYKNHYFIDKSKILHEFNKLLYDRMNCVCITKPRRFGKSSIADMIIAYYSKKRQEEFKEIFNTLKISGNKISNLNGLLDTSENSENEDVALKEIKKEYENTQGKYHTIFIDFSNNITRYDNVNDFLSEIEKKIIFELNIIYKSYNIDKYGNLYKNNLNDYLEYLYSETRERFIFVIDEWDCMFVDNLFTIEERKYYLSFLKCLLKDKSYVAFTYMTGVLPIAKGTSGTSLNNFREFTMLKDKIFYKYFGITEDEIRYLCEKNGQLRYEDMENWYNGYKSYNGEKIFNTWTVMNALNNNSIDNYWNESGSKNEIKNNINFNFNGVKEEFLKLVVGEKIKIQLNGYGAENTQKIVSKIENENEEKNTSIQKGITINTKKNEMYSKMVVYGLLTYYENEISIPNNELREKFIELVNEEEDFEEFKKLINNSEDLLEATLNKNTDEVCKILNDFHMRNTPLKQYNHFAFSSILFFAYYYARDKYFVEKEETDSNEIADFIFYPKNYNDTGIIIEIKVDETPENAIQQIYNKQYYKKLEKRNYKCDILLVGINLKEKEKEYSCIIEYFNKKNIKEKKNNKIYKHKKNNGNDDDNIVNNKRKRKQEQTKDSKNKREKN